jgi:hypothetical protein
MWHSPEINVLMETSNPLNDKPVVYIGPHPKTRVIYDRDGDLDICSSRGMSGPGMVLALQCGLHGEFADGWPNPKIKT